MATVSNSEIAATRIPKITDLRDILYYGDATLNRCSAFADDLRVFRRKYISKGLHGSDLWDWKSSEHQAALNDMTQAFLEGHGYGEIYWPSDPTSPNFNELQYSKNRALITRTLKQLIFRINLQQYRNKKYKHKDQYQSDSKVPEIIRIEDDEETPTFPTINRENPSSYDPIENHTKPTSSADIYDVPSSPDHEAESTHTKRKFDAVTNTLPIKRSKLDKLPFGKDRIQNINQNVPKAQQRSSPRSRKTVQRPDYATVDDLNRAIASGEADLISSHDDTRTSRQTSVEQSPINIEEVLHHIRTTRPSETCETAPPTPTLVQRKLTQDSHIDPSLEKIFPPSSIRHPRPRSSSVSSSVVYPTLPSPASTTATFQPMRNTIPKTTTLAQSPASTMTTFQQARETVPQVARLSQSRTSTTATFQPVRETTPQTAPLAPSPGAQGSQKSTIPSVIPSPAPSSITTRDTTAPPRSSIDFSYAVILSRTPKYHCKTWTPRGHFLEKSLNDLITEIPFDDDKTIEGLKIRLEGPGVKLEETLKCDEEAKFEITKGRFLKRVKICLKNHNKMNPGKKLAMGFEVEAWRENEAEDDEDDDDSDIVLMF